MAHVTDPYEIKKILANILKPLIRSKENPNGPVSPEDALALIGTLSEIIKDAGGLDLSDRNLVGKLKHSIVTGLTTMKQSPENNTEIKDTLKLLFKDQNSLSPEDKKKLTLGLSYIIAMERDPNFKPNMGLALKDPKTLSPADKNKLLEDLENLANILNNTKNPKDRLDKKDLDLLIKLLKDEIKNPGITKEKTNPNSFEFDKDFKEMMQNMDILQGKRGGVASNYTGIASEAAYSLTPLALLSGEILNWQQAATGVEAAAADRDEALGERNDIVDTFITSQDPDLKLSHTNPEHNDFLPKLENAAIDALDSLTASLGANPENETPDSQAPSAEEEEPGSKYTSPSPLSMRPKPPGSSSAAGG